MSSANRRASPPPTPAQVVVEAFDGVRAAARALERDPATIHRWLKTGLVSADAQGRVLDLSDALDLGLTADQLILRAPKRKEARRGRQ